MQRLGSVRPTWQAALRALAFAAALAATACASLPPPSPIVEQSRQIDLRLGGG